MPTDRIDPTSTVTAPEDSTREPSLETDSGSDDLMLVVFPDLGKSFMCRSLEIVAPLVTIKPTATE